MVPFNKTRRKTSQETAVGQNNENISLRKHSTLDFCSDNFEQFEFLNPVYIKDNCG